MSFHWLPNAISLLRIVLVVPVAWLILRGQHTQALYLFMLAGISDGVDGFLAKRFRWQSDLGALLDPVADKLLLMTSFAALYFGNLIPLWLAVLVVGRDLIIVGGAIAYHVLIQTVKGAPTRVSKLNTALELLFVVAVLAQAAMGLNLGELVMALGAAVFVTVIVSGIDYVLCWSAKARQGRSAA